MAMMFFAALSGFCFMVLSMPQHQRVLLAKVLPSKQRLLVRLLAYLILLAALWPAIISYGISVGISVWLMLLSLMAWLPLLLLSYASSRQFLLVTIVSSALTCLASGYLLL